MQYDTNVLSILTYFMFYTYIYFTKQAENITKYY